jgi:preprotein translocase subunit SecF
LMEVDFGKNVNKNDVMEVVTSLDFIKDAKVQTVNDTSVIIRTNPLSQDELSKMQATVNDKVGEYTEVRLDNIGPTISGDTTKKAIWAVVLASVGIILYIAYAFRSVPKPANSWRFGATAVLALLHDTIISTGLYILLGHFFNFEIDSLFIVAILTILGYSVNDTIVVYDRIRENLKTHPEYSFTENVNKSLTQTLARSINSSMTLILVLLALLFLGGESIRGFITLLLIGTFFGTYSSIFVAPPLLIVWQNHITKKKNLS